MTQGRNRVGPKSVRGRTPRRVGLACTLILLVGLGYGAYRLLFEGLRTEDVVRQPIGEVLEGETNFGLDDGLGETVPAPAPSTDRRGVLPESASPSFGRVAGGTAPISPPLELAHLRSQIDVALDHGAGVSARISAVRWLRRLGGSEALHVLERIATGPEYASLRELAALELGRFDDPEANAILERMAFELASEDDAAGSALHVSVLEALLIRGNTEARQSLRDMILDVDAPRRMAAARALLSSGDPGNASWLSREVDAGNLPADDAIDALAMAPWSETEGFFRGFIEDEERPLEIRLEALQALSDVAGDVSAFAFEIATTSPEPELRSGAYDALAFRFEDDALAPRIAPQILTEEDPSVRDSLYGYLMMHPREAENSVSSELLLERALEEAEPSTRLSAAMFLAQMARTAEQPVYAKAFENRVIPWLVESALSATTTTERRRSTDALALSGIPAARDALEDLSRRGDEDLAVLAERALSMVTRPKDR